jgi:branched-chain amino acid transport system ATP-binding protein
VLKLADVHTAYGPIEALSGIDMEIDRGEIVCLIGNNGAGKSTALMTVSGILKPAGGDIVFEGESIKGVPPHTIVRMGISQVPEGRRIFPKLTVGENLEMGAFAVRRNLKKTFDMVYTLFPVLHERKKQAGGTLSGGEQQMLAIGRALMSDPVLLLLDEPSLGLAPIMVSKIFRTVKEINREGVTVLLVEQNARAALKLSDRGYVLENGRITLEGKGEDLMHNDRIRKAYLGE